MRTIVMATMVVVTMAVFPGFASAQETRRETLPGFGSSLRAVTATPIDARDLERRLAPAERSPLLLSLYGTLAGLNVLDVVSTRAAIGRGAVELNPIMKDAIGSNALSIGIKSATTLATVLAIDRIAKRNRKAGIVAAIVANGVTAAIVANNLRQAR